MNLEITNILAAPGDHLPAPGDDAFLVNLSVDIGEIGKPGAETFHFIAASPAGLRGEIGPKGFTLVRGLILMDRFSVETVRRAVGNVLNHARALKSWDEVVTFISRYSRYDAEDVVG